MMTMKELKQKMTDAGSDGSSKLHLRSEDLQQKFRVERIPRLKNGLKKAARILLEAEIALPFDPETGESDPNGFNSHNKYRPPFSATTTALALKQAANENEKLKTTLMNRAGIEEWDTANFSEFTADDWIIFKKYRVPRIFSLIVTHITIPAMTSSKYGMNYAVTVERDSEGNPVGEVPGFLVANKFFRDRAYEELAAYNKSLESGECKDDDKVQKEHSMGIFNNIPVTEDIPANFVRLFELPLDTDYKISSDVKMNGVTKESIKDFEVLSNYKKKLRVGVESYLETNWKEFDNFFDFFEMDQICPTTGDDSSDKGKAQIGQDTKFDRPTIPLDSHKHYADGKTTERLVAAIREYIDNDVNVEERVRRSMRVPVYDETVEDKLYQTLSTVINLHGDEYITQEVIKSNQQFLRSVFPDEADELIEEVDAGISEKEVGALDSEDASKIKGTYDLSDDEFNDDLGVDTAEVDLTPDAQGNDTKTA